MPLSPLKNPPARVVTSERPFIQPTCILRQTSSSQPATCTSEMPVVQPTELVNQFTASQGQPITVTSEMPVQQSTGPVSQRTSSQTSKSKKVLHTASVSGAAVNRTLTLTWNSSLTALPISTIWRKKVRFLTK